MTTLSTLVRGCIWVMGFSIQGLSEHSRALLSVALWVVAKLLCSCLCLCDAAIELHATNEKKHSMVFSLESENGFYMKERLV